MSTRPVHRQHAIKSNDQWPTRCLQQLDTTHTSIDNTILEVFIQQQQKIHLLFAWMRFEARLRRGRTMSEKTDADKQKGFPFTAQMDAF